MALLVAFLAPVAPVLAATDPFDAACKAPGASGSAACSNPSRGGSSPITGPTGILTRITSFISYIAGIAAVIIIIVGGIMYVTSGGDPSKVSNAKDAVMYALIGVVIAVIAQAIIFFVLNKI